MHEVKETAVSNHTMASMNLPWSSWNSAAASCLDSSIGHKAGNGNSSLHLYPKLISCHAGRDSDVVVSSAWGRSSRIYLKVVTMSYLSPGKGVDQKVTVDDPTAGLDHMRVHTNHLQTYGCTFRPGVDKKIDNGSGRGRVVYGPLGVHF